MTETNNIYVVIDTNVLVSALISKNPESNPTRIIEAVIKGLIVPLYNQDIIKEYREVLARDKFRLNHDLTENFISFLVSVGINATRKEDPTYIFPDKDDMVFYEIAFNAEGSFLITGNIKHFPAKSFIVTPAEMIEILKDKGLIK